MRALRLVKNEGRKKPQGRPRARDGPQYDTDSWRLRPRLNGQDLNAAEAIPAPFQKFGQCFRPMDENRTSLGTEKPGSDLQPLRKRYAFSNKR